MVCSTNKFVINKGIDNEFLITIKQTGTTVPMEIVAGDTFSARIYDQETSSIVLTPTVTIESSVGGIIKLDITANDTASVKAHKGGYEDRYYLKPMYRLAIDCNTQNNGKFVAKVPSVYVE